MTLHLDSDRVGHDEDSGTFPIPACEWNRKKNKAKSRSCKVTVDRRADIDCPECARIVEETGKCFGCGKAFPLREKHREDHEGGKKAGTIIRSNVHELILASPEMDDRSTVTVSVCGSTRYYNPHGARYPKADCARRAFEKARICPGCGEGFSREEDGTLSMGSTNLGFVCGPCREHLDKARNLEKQGKLEWYAITDDVVPHLWRSDDGGEEKEALLECLAKVAAGVGRRVERNHRGQSKVLVLEVVDPSEGRGLRTYKKAGHVEWAVELTEEQAKVLAGLSKAVHDAIDAAYRKGAREGKSVLMQLARGEETIDGFNEASARLERAHEVVEREEEEDEDEENET